MPLLAGRMWEGGHQATRWGVRRQPEHDRAMHDISKHVVVMHADILRVLRQYLGGCGHHACCSESWLVNSLQFRRVMSVLVARRPFLFSSALSLDGECVCVWTCHVDEGDAEVASASLRTKLLILLRTLCVAEMFSQRDAVVGHV